MKKRSAVQEAAAAMGRARWKGVSAGERSALMKKVRGDGPTGRKGGRKRQADRCYCGEHTWHSATNRRFDCCKRAGKYPTGKPERLTKSTNARKLAVKEPITK